MTDTNPTPDTEALRADIISTGTSPTPAKALSTEDQRYADTIVAMDPFKDVPGCVSKPEGFKLPELRATGLPPGPERSQIEAQLQGLTPEQRSAKEPRLVGAALRKLLPEIRMMTGLGEGATTYHREQALIAREHSDLKRQLATYTEELDAVRSYRTDYDPQTGEPVSVAVPVFEQDGRTARLYQQKEIQRQMRVLFNEDGTYGVEAKRRMGEALRESATLMRKRDEQLAEGVEVRKRAEEINREDRINRQAEALARMNRNAH